MRQLADELRAETGEERRISGDEDNLATGNPVKETAAEPGAGSQEEEEEEVEDEDEEEEDPGYGNSGDNDDDDSPPASSHRPVTRSTPKKPVSHPKWKDFRNKSGPGSSSQKRIRRR